MRREKVEQRLDYLKSLVELEKVRPNIIPLDMFSIAVNATSESLGLAIQPQQSQPQQPQPHVEQQEDSPVVEPVPIQDAVPSVQTEEEEESTN